MKKVKYGITAVLLVVCIAAAAWLLAGCGGSTLEVDTTDAVLIFEVGEEFSSDGIVVYEKQGGKNVRLPKSEYTVTAPDTSSEGEKTVTITAGDRSVTYDISVVVPEVTAVFTGDITAGLGGGATMTYTVEFKCYNTLKWELWYTDSHPAKPGMGEYGIKDSGRYTVEDGVYTMTLKTSTVKTSTDENGDLAFSYTGIGLPVAGGMVTGTFNGMLTLSD